MLLAQTQPLNELAGEEKYNKIFNKKKKKKIYK
jgi:hypothetical protein